MTPEPRYARLNTSLRVLSLRTPVGRLARQLVIGSAYRHEERGRAYLSSLTLLGLRLDKLSLVLHTFLGKETLGGELKKLFDDLDLDKLRVARPSKFIFLCGGVILKTKGARAINLRDYIYRTRPMRRLKHPIVLAEQATALYRDTEYKDLISFEEDIAKISAVIVLIAESAGSLAELGSFSSLDTIRPALRVILQEDHSKTESFVRYGPIQRVMRHRRENVGIFPWRTNSKQQLILRSVKPHFSSIYKYISDQTKAIPTSTFYHSAGESAEFYTIYWIIYLAFCITPSTLYQEVKSIYPNLSDSDIRNKIYCMELAGWVGRQPYGGKDYFFAKQDKDPFEYRFKPGTKSNDSARRKMDVATYFKKLEITPKHVFEQAQKERGVK